MPPADHVSMRQIADAAKVSVSCVSLALRDSPKVSAAKRDEIRHLAEKLGYRSDPRIAELMAHLRVNRADRAPSTIAFVIPELTREQMKRYAPIVAMLAGVRQMAKEVGFGVDVFYMADPGMTLVRLRSIIIARGIRGIIFAPYASGVTKVDFDITGFSVATAGYSVIAPHMHRACPDYLQLMDELIDAATRLGHRRLGLAMTYGEGGNGHKLFTSSFLFYQSKIPGADRIPILSRAAINAGELKNWMREHRPDVIISAASVYHRLLDMGVRIPQDVSFLSIDLSEPPEDAAGADQCYPLVGAEAFQLVVGQMHMNQTGEPAAPKVLLVDSHQRKGFSLIPKNHRMGKSRSAARPRAKNAPPSFLGFLH